MNDQAETASSGQVLTFQMHRVRKGMHVELAEGPAQEAAGTPMASNPPARAAVMLALAHKIQQAIDQGRIKDQAEAARRLGFTRARITQVMRLTLMPVKEQERVLGAQACRYAGIDSIMERWAQSHEPEKQLAEESNTVQACVLKLSGNLPLTTGKLNLRA